MLARALLISARALPARRHVTFAGGILNAHPSCRSGHVHVPDSPHCWRADVGGAIRLLATREAGPLEATQRTETELRLDLHVVLVHPQIPQNTGSIARTCAATGVGLHLVGPLGFELSTSKLKRAGLDYWEHVCMRVHKDIAAFLSFYSEQPEPKRMIGYSKFAKVHFAQEGLYGPGTWLLFGSEVSGLPKEATEAIAADSGNSALVKIPMQQRHVRSLNLATSVGIGVYEAMRQLDGPILPDVDNF